LKLFTKKSKAVIGIDIGTHSIKLVELAGSKASPRVVAWAIVPLPAGAFSENAIANATKVLGMPSDISELELEEQISIEALHFIPYPIDEVNLDFEVIGQSETSEDENDVLPMLI